jgi:hypothetical protein
MSELIEACKQNRFPSVSTLCDYGLDGRDGINPVALFELYRTAVLKKKVTSDQLENALKSDNLKSIVGISVRSGLNQPSFA